MLGLRQTSISNDKITLIGMMGTGKSKFGRLVAKNLNFNFYDVDTLIEKKFKTSIKDLFMKYGEPFFRNIEAKTIKKLIANIRKKNEKHTFAILKHNNACGISTRESLKKSYMSALEAEGIVTPNLGSSRSPYTSPPGFLWIQLSDTT